MKNLNISIKDLSHLKLDNRYLFLTILLIVLFLDGLVIKDAVGIVLHLESQTAPETPPAAGARINFKDYDFVVQRIQNGQNFKPSDGLTKDPFNPSAPVPPPAPALSGTASSTPPGH